VSASLLVRWCEDLPCDSLIVPGHYSNAVASQAKWAVVAEEIRDPTHPRIIEASQDIQNLKLYLLEQAEAPGRAIPRGDEEGVEKAPMDEESVEEIYGLPPVPGIPPGYEQMNTMGLTPWATVELLEGEVFISRSGSGKWTGPIKGSPRIFQGDVIYTKKGGRVRLRGEGRENAPEGPLWWGGAEITGDTMLITGIKEQGWLKWGAIYTWENIKSVIRTGEPLPDTVDSYAPQLRKQYGGFYTTYTRSAPKGTEYIIEVDKETQIAKYTVNEGIVEVWLKDDPSIRRELGAGESVRVTGTSIEDNVYAWDTLLEKYGWTDRDLSDPLVGEAAGLVGELRTAIPGGTVSVPVRLQNVGDVGSLNFNVTYDSSVINIDRVDKGSLLSGISFVVNPNETGIIRFGFATVNGISGTGPIGYIVCNAVGSAGSSTPLTISEVEATDSSGNPFTLQTISGLVIINSDRDIGDSNGDGVLTELDALAALRMSVDLLAEDLILDMDQDGRVTAKDALAILSIAVRGS